MLSALPWQFSIHEETLSEGKVHGPDNAIADGGAFSPLLG